MFKEDGIMVSVSPDGLVLGLPAWHPKTLMCPLRTTLMTIPSYPSPAQLRAFFRLNCDVETFSSAALTVTANSQTHTVRILKSLLLAIILQFQEGVIVEEEIINSYLLSCVAHARNPFVVLLLGLKETCCIGF